MNTLQGASYAGLAFAFWEILITLQDEVDLMWAHPKRFTIVKALYFFVRYFGLAVQIVNSGVARILQAIHPVPRERCRLWLAYQAVTIYLLLGAVDVILMIRVYAFYSRSRWIGYLMIALLFARVSLSTASAVLTVPNQKFDYNCLNADVPTLVMYFFMIGEVTLQSIILGLTFLRHLTAIRAGWARTPIVTLLCRDSATAFTIIVGVLIGTIVYARLEYTHDSAHAVFPAFVAILSSVGCRLIIGMQKLAVRNPEAESSTSTRDSQEFTTVIFWERTASGQSLSLRTPSSRTPSLPRDA
ncbi:hypothetical protein CVT26_000310 [Gymnopilus dilepis]|uniref:DUF6533 domain-containing protein n=1 Tax=Gymnopilus dilepis TaxID=231916 RepID=A0A409VHE0_9AGAR|nr:hypothetical protein CVT26_000310 [Gymnopilus dilepis]